MDDLFKCICEFDDNHYWLRCFLRQIGFYLKNILANPTLYDVDHNQYFDDLTKNAIWKEIAYDYKGKFAKSQ